MQACILLDLTQWCLLESHISHLWCVHEGSHKMKISWNNRSTDGTTTESLKNWVTYIASEEIICVRKVDINETVINYNK